MITRETIEAATGDRVAEEPNAELVGLVFSDEPKTLTFLDDAKYAAELCANPNISAVLILAALTADVKAARPDIVCFEVDDPRWSYFSIHNHLARVQAGSRKPTIIDPTAIIHPRAVIAEHGVTIGARTVVHANVSILPDVVIGEDCIIDPNAVLGTDGFEIKRTSRGLLPVVHDGEILIGDRVEIGANTCIDKGFKHRPTVLSDDVKVDNLVHVAHSAVIGPRTLVVAGTVVGGNCRIGSDVWVGINVSLCHSVELGDGAFISMGAVVSRHVAAGQQVTGNLAVPHDKYLAMLKKALRDVQ